MLCQSGEVMPEDTERPEFPPPIITKWVHGGTVPTEKQKSSVPGPGTWSLAVYMT